jgi:MFS family permease
VLARLGRPAARWLRAQGGFLGNASIRRLEAALAASLIGDWAFAVGLAVFAFESGGTAAVGLIGLIRLLPAAILSPFAGVLGDRYRRERVMLASLLVRTLVLGIAVAVVSSDAPDRLVYLLPAFDGLAATAFRPAQAAVLPSLARTPNELTAANIAASTIESVAFFAGPGLAGLLLAFTDTRSVFAASGALFVWAAVLVARVESGVAPRVHREGVLREATAGARLIAADRRLRLLVGLYGAQTLVAGVVNVLIVVTALDLLAMGESGVGFLNAAVGVGGVLGGAAAVVLIGRHRIAVGFALGALLWGFPIALIGSWPNQGLALAALGLVGIGNTVVDVAAITLLQRGVPDEVLARVFAVLEGLLVGMIALGSILAPVLTAAFGIRGALIASGAFLPVLIALSWRGLVVIDIGAPPPERALALLRAVPIFAPLPAAKLDELAARLVPVTTQAGEVVFRRGDSGETFYVLARGEIELVVAGKPAVQVRPGDYFGEIALLADVPRTATATARADSSLYALDGPTFVAAVTGHAESAKAAAAVISSRLGSLRPGLASI